MPYGNKKVSGYLCGEQLIPSENIEDTKTQACRNLKSRNFLHRYPKIYRPRTISQLDIQRTPGQTLYVFPLGEFSNMKRFRSKLIRKKINIIHNQSIHKLA